MTLAYDIKTVRIIGIKGLEGPFLVEGTRWQTGQLLFRSKRLGSEVPTGEERWAWAKDERGRNYFIWTSCHPKAGGLVIQRADSPYCYALTPLDIT